MYRRYASLILLIASTQIVSILLTALLWSVYFAELYVVPAEPETSTGYGVLFSLIPIASSFLIIRLFRIKGIRVLIALLQSLVVVISVYIILLPFLGDVSFFTSIASLIASIAVLAKGGPRLKTAFVCTFSALASVLMTLSFPLMVILVLSTILAAFDLYAVFKGPLSRGIPMALVAETKHVAMGVGDMIFYALIPSTLLVHKGAIICLGALILINVGALISVQLLYRRETVPGLPIPLLLTLPLFFV